MAEESKLDPLKGLGQGERLKRVMQSTEQSEEAMKSENKEVISTKLKQLLTCPMYCRSNCAAKHHPLLVALLNCKYSEDEEEMNRRLTDLLMVVNRYKKISRWGINEEIPDSTVPYKYPMIHWAAALGNIEALKCLLDYGLSPTAVSLRFEGETALHKALLCLQETTPINCFEKFEQLVSVLEDTLPIADNSGNTVLHACCEYLANEIPKFQYFQHCLLSILYHYRSKNKDKELGELVAKQNKEGNTCLHLLARSDKCCMQVRSLLRESSCEDCVLTSITNHMGQRPIDVAEYCGAASMVHHLMCIMNKTEEELESMKEDAVEGGSEEKEKATDKPCSNVVYDRKGNIIGEKLVIQPGANLFQRTSTGDKVSPTGHNSIEPPMKIMKVATEFQDSRKGEIILMVPESLASNGDEVKEEAAPKPALTPVDSDSESLPGTMEDTTVAPQQEKEAQQTSSSSTFTITPKLERELVRSNHFFVYLKKHPDWKNTGELPQSYDQIDSSNRPGLDMFLSTLSGYEREEIVEALSFDLENLLKKLKVMTSTEDDLSSKYELLQDQQMKLVLEVQKLLHKLNRLKKEESALVESIQGIQAELTTTHATHQGLKERLQHCNAALKVLEEIEEQSESVGQSSSSASQGSS